MVNNQQCTYKNGNCVNVNFNQVESFPQRYQIATCKKNGQTDLYELNEHNSDYFESIVHGMTSTVDNELFTFGVEYGREKDDNHFNCGFTSINYCNKLKK